MKLVLGILIVAVSGLAGCNTVQGIGKDIEKGGEAIQKAVYQQMASHLNLEVDLLARYVVRYLQAGHAPTQQPQDESSLLATLARAGLEL